MRPTNFERFSGVMAIVVGICGFLYAIVFVILKNELLFSLLLLLIGVLSTAAINSCLLPLTANRCTLCDMGHRVSLGISGRLSGARRL